MTHLYSIPNYDSLDPPLGGPLNSKRHTESKAAIVYTLDTLAAGQMLQRGLLRGFIWVRRQRTKHKARLVAVKVVVARHLWRARLTRPRKLPRERS